MRHRVREIYAKDGTVTGVVAESSESESDWSPTMADAWEACADRMETAAARLFRQAKGCRDRAGILRSRGEK